MSASASSTPRRWLRQPVLHFALLGVALFALRAAWRAEQGPPGPTREPIVIGAERVHQMEAAFTERWGAQPTAPQLRALVNQAVEEELLYREARVLALGFQDGSVRRRLLEKVRALHLRPTRDSEDAVQAALALGLDDDLVIRRLLAEKMRLVLQQDDLAAPPDEAALRDYLQRNRERYLQPETVTFTHVFFSARTRGVHAGADAAAARAQLDPEPPSAAAEQLSDPFPLGQRMLAYTPAQLMGRFGKPFADQVLALPPRTWSQALTSPFGLHLVWVDEHLPERLPALEAVRAPLTQRLAEERAARNLARGLERLRALYDVRVETDASTS